MPKPQNFRLRRHLIQISERKPPSVFTQPPYRGGILDLGGEIPPLRKCQNKIPPPKIPPLRKQERRSGGEFPPVHEPPQAKILTFWSIQRSFSL